MTCNYILFWCASWIINNGGSHNVSRTKCFLIKINKGPKSYSPWSPGYLLLNQRLGGVCVKPPEHQGMAHKHSGIYTRLLKPSYHPSLFYGQLAQLLLYKPYTHRRAFSFRLVKVIIHPAIVCAAPSLELQEGWFLRDNALMFLGHIYLGRVTVKHRHWEIYDDKWQVKVTSLPESCFSAETPEQKEKRLIL